MCTVGCSTAPHTYTQMVILQIRHDTVCSNGSLTRLFCQHMRSVSIWWNTFVTVQILRFPQQCNRGFCSFGMAHCVVLCLQNVSIQLRPWMLYKGNMLVWSVQEHIGSDTATHLRRLQFLSNCLSIFVCIILFQIHQHPCLDVAVRAACQAKSH